MHAVLQFFEHAGSTDIVFLGDSWLFILRIEGWVGRFLSSKSHYMCTEYVLQRALVLFGDNTSVVVALIAVESTTPRNYT